MSQTNTILSFPPLCISCLTGGFVPIGCESACHSLSICSAHGDAARRRARRQWRGAVVAFCLKRAFRSHQPRQSPETKPTSERHRPTRRVLVDKSPRTNVSGRETQTHADVFTWTDSAASASIWQILSVISTLCFSSCDRFNMFGDFLKCSTAEKHV